MFKNSLSTTKSKLDLIDIYNHALDSIRPARLINKALSFRDDVLTIRSSIEAQVPINIDLKNKNVHLIGAGKSALAMACGVAFLAKKAGSSQLFSHGMLSLPVEQRSHLEKDGEAISLLNLVDVKFMFGSRNNLPDYDSIVATKSILSKIKMALVDDESKLRKPIFLVLISGGGSACLSFPRYISLEEKLELIKYLVQGGADIVELNKVRRFFSYVKGGQLAQFILDNHPQSLIQTLILSDVIGDPIDYIASGPTSCPANRDKLEQEQAIVRDILNKYKYPSKISALYQEQTSTKSIFVDVIFGETKRLNNSIIGNNIIAMKAARERAEVLGYEVVMLSNELQGPGKEIVEYIICEGRDSLKTSQKVLVLGAGEATINRQKGEGWGIGGRAQEMALDYMISKISNVLKSEVGFDLFIAGGTDGQDGPTDAAACLASYSEWLEATCDKFSLADAIKAKHSHDSYRFWNTFKPDWLIRTGLTGTNVMDLYMLMLIKPENL